MVQDYGSCIVPDPELRRAGSGSARNTALVHEHGRGVKTWRHGDMETWRRRAERAGRGVPTQSHGPGSSVGLLVLVVDLTPAWGPRQLIESCRGHWQPPSPSCVVVVCRRRLRLAQPQGPAEDQRRRLGRYSHGWCRRGEWGDTRLAVNQAYAAGS